jgi:4,5-dihydroxyphthalate decarboxylase
MAQTGRRRLQIAVATSDRIAPFRDRAVRPDSFDLEFADAPAEQIFWRALHSEDFDLTEMSLAAFCILRSRGDQRFVGLPVFTSRLFRHNSVFVRHDSAIGSFRELAGRRVGLPEYQMTAAVWVRGLLAEQYGVDLRSIEWYVGGVEKPGRKERISLDPPAGYRIHRLDDNQTLAGLLADGAIDAYMSAGIPAALGAAGGVRRLLADPGAEERHYFARERIFPIMHMLVLRRRCYDADPGLARDVYDAFAAAKDVAARRLYNTETLAVMLPWLNEEYERTRELMGPDCWPYGVGRNEHCLGTFLRLLAGQQLLARPLTVADLFPSELLDT